MEMAVHEAAQEKQLLETEVSELRVRLQSSEERAEAMAIQCKAVELKLWKTKAQRDRLKANNQELLTQLDETMWRAEHQKTSLQSALKEEAVTLCQEVASLQRQLERLEKERKDVQHERELYEQQMRDLEKKNEMHAPHIHSWDDIIQQLEMEREGMQEDLEHGAAGTLNTTGREELEGRENIQSLSAALCKSEMAKVTWKKDLAILQGRASDTGTGQSHLQVGTGIHLQSTTISQNYSNNVSHKEVGSISLSVQASLGKAAWAAAGSFVYVLGSSQRPLTAALFPGMARMIDTSLELAIQISSRPKAGDGELLLLCPHMTRQHMCEFGFGVGMNGAGEQSDGLNPAEFWANG
ncbi:hypothetical protein HGM15179_021475 [Zosterops borbonicus]|uniref:CEP250 coiled coil domain-containing protein n=1 Tax=Zosterops borbonicus TaxID=364589 RepID=A0A8K1FW93_9PASS|nr:hypothetical protein HGM15179_022066 [Zosterops borbonicus]TRZ05632.1 hypothetical protein HGM15179_021475 [Zosterops borbonicus]